jgi:glycosyltransferase involved in cell wall biosynthesis
VKQDLFVGVTTWNSELFLEKCLESIRETTSNIGVGVVDNCSTDNSAAIARRFGATVHVESCSQAIALNRLLAMSAARHTLLMHSDVILLSKDWYTLCARHLNNDVALISPEDIGCGPLTRPYGAGKPESCFMLFDTAKARRMRTWKWVRSLGLPRPVRHLDLDDYYVTHDLPNTLSRHGFLWRPMRVHPSPSSVVLVYEPQFTPEYWSTELSHLRYAMGNFYSIDNVITHYHNWFDRVPKDVPIESFETTEGQGRGLPLAYLSLGTRHFLTDLDQKAIQLPSTAEIRAPALTPRHTPDLSTPFKMHKNQSR